MQLATTTQTLEFLQTEYTKFHSYSKDQQAQVLEFNELVRAPLDHAELPLRILYIDLLMHDEMLRRSKAIHDTKRDRIAILVRNKVALQVMIRNREKVQESVTPDPRTEAKDADLPDLLVWFPEAQREAFAKQLQPVWRRWKKGKIEIQQLMERVLERCVVLGCRSVETFRALVTLIEWILHQTETCEPNVSP